MIAPTPNSAPGPSPSPSSRNGDDEIALHALLNALLRRRGAIVFVPLLVAVALVGWGLTRERRWASTASFSVQAAESPSRISGLAAQFGLAVSGSEGAQSPAFFVELVKSREILNAAALTLYDADGRGPAVAQPLSQLLRVTGTDSAQVTQRTIQALSDAIAVNKSRETGVIRLSVSTKTAPLAHDVVERLLQLVDDFNRRSRRSQAALQREFVERRLAGAHADLKAVEDRLQEFATRNRQFEGASQLRLQQDRLERDVLLKQSLVQTLSTSYEQARIDEIRDMPAIMIIDRPDVPVKPESRGLAKRGVLAFVVGVALAMAVVLVQAMFNRRTQTPEQEVAEFHALWREAVGDLFRPWRPLLRAVRR